MGNGDICSAFDAVSMIKETGCDGVMIARGCEGRPWLFAEISSALEGKTRRIGHAEKIAAIRKHMRLMLEYKGARGIIESRSQLAWYMKGFYGAAGLRARAVTVESAEDIEDIINSIPETEDDTDITA